ncbi:MAG: ferritin [Candidatus Bathyarchaeia archaeon]
MEISNDLTEAINEQINFELYSGYVYLSMASWFEDNNLDGMAHWMKLQADEEYEHAMLFWDHVVDRGGKVILKEVKGPKTEWESPLEAWQDAYEHELEVTERIYNIGEMAEEQGDKATMAFLKWFYDEQVEEEEQTMKVRDLLEMIGDSKNALLRLDEKLGQREEE